MKIVGVEVILEYVSRIKGTQMERLGVIPMYLDTEPLDHIRLRLIVKPQLGGVTEFFLDLNDLRRIPNA